MLLTLAMMLSMVPAVSAAETADNTAPEVSVTEPVTLDPEALAARDELRHARLECAEDDLTLFADEGEYTVNVTLEFSSKAPRDTEIQMDLIADGGYFSSGAYLEKTLEKGDSSLEFTAKVDKGSYRAEFYSDISTYGWVYADLNGELLTDGEYNWDDMMHIAAFGEDKTIDVTVNGDPLLEMDEGEDPVGTEVEVTVELPAKLTEDTRFMTALRSGNSTYSNTRWVDAGSTSYTTTFYTSYSTFTVAYSDVTDCDSRYNIRYDAGARYIAEDGGITTQFSEAKVFNTAESSQITLEEPDCYALTGTLKLESKKDRSYGLYAVAEFEDGERYAGRVVIPAGSTSGTFTIYVPKSQQGNTFTYWACGTSDFNSNRLNETSRQDGGQFTLSKSAQLDTITLPDPPIIASGTVYLPDGHTAPSGGMGVYVELYTGDDWISQELTIPAGKNSVDFSLSGELGSRDEYSLYVYLDAPDSISDEMNFYLPADELLDLDVYMQETVLVSGTIHVPEECRDLGSNIRLYTNCNNSDFDYYKDAYVTVLPGSTSVSYELKVLKGYESRVYIQVARDATGMLLTDDLYVQEDGSVSPDYTQITPTEDMTDVDVTYTRGKTISGTITLADGLDAGLYNGEVRARPVYGGDTYYNNFRFEGTEGTYSLAVPFDGSDAYILSFAVYDYEIEGVLTDTYVYYSEAGMTMDQDNATELTVPEEGLDGIDLVIQKSISISGTITVPAGLPTNVEYRGRVEATNTSTYESCGTSFEFTGSRGSYTLGVPVDDSATYLVSIYLYDEGIDGVMTYTDYYWSTSGMTASEDAATPVTPGAAGIDGIDLVIPKGVFISGDLSIPSDLPDDYGYSGRVQIYDDNGNEYDNYFNFSDGRTSYSVSLPADYTGTYRLSVYLYESDDCPDNLITYTDLYLTEDGTYSASKDKAAKFTVGADGLVQDLEIPAGKPFSINLKAPVGFSGEYDGYLYLTNASTNRGTSRDFTFTDSGSVSISVLPGDVAEYYLQLRVYSGPGAMTDTTYYYANGGWTKNYNSRTTFSTESDSIDLYLPAGKNITGKLVSADGSPIDLGENSDDNYGSLYFNAVNSDYLSCSSTVNADGTFVITIPDDATGTHKLRFSPQSSSYGCNVVSRSYYYVPDATTSTTSSSDAAILDVSGDVGPLTIVVDTGYVLTGTVKLGENATMTSTRDDDRVIASISVNLRENTEGSYFSAYSYISFYRGETSWNYSVAVPKKDAEYTLAVDRVDLNDGTTSNVYDGRMTISDSIAVSGDATLPNIVLQPAKATVSVAITNPAASSVSGNVYLKAGENTYQQYISIDAGETGTYELRIAPTETAETYTVYYYIYNTPGLSSYKNIYVAADGQLTLVEEEAAPFTWAATSHAITLMEIPPFAVGKIYLPGYEDENFNISLYASGYDFASTWLNVSPSTVKTDPDGSKYIEYIFSDEDFSSGDTYYLYYRLNYTSDPTTDTVDDFKWDGNFSYYLAEDGALSSNYNDRVTFTVPDTIKTVQDFTLVDWDYGTEDNLIQSEHGFLWTSDYEPVVYTYSCPGAYALQVFFDDRTDVHMNINGDVEYNYYVRGSSVTVYGDTLTISCDSAQYDLSYGFGITDIVPRYSDPGAAVPGISAVSTENGSGDSVVMSDLRAGEAVSVVLTTPDAATATVIAALYDGNRMIDVAMNAVTLTESGSVGSSFSFDNCANADTLKIMVIGSDYAPVADVCTISG